MGKGIGRYVLSARHMMNSVASRTTAAAAAAKPLNLLNFTASSKAGNAFPLGVAAAAVKHEDDRRLFHNAALRKHRREVGDQTDSIRRLNRSRCTLCSAEIETSSVIPNHALRAAAAAVNHEDDRRLFHNAALRKRRKEVGDQTGTRLRLLEVGKVFAYSTVPYERS